MYCSHPKSCPLYFAI